MRIRTSFARGRGGRVDFVRLDMSDAPSNTRCFLRRGGLGLYRFRVFVCGGVGRDVLCQCDGVAMRCCGVVFALCWAQWISYPLQCCSNSWQVVQTLPGRGLRNEKWGRVFLGPAGVGYDKIDNLRGEFPGGIREVIDGGNRNVPRPRMGGCGDASRAWFWMC